MIFGGSTLIFGSLTTWTTPLWLLSVGVAVGMAVLVVFFGLMFLVSRPLAQAAVVSVREGILLPIFYLACAVTGFALLAPVLVPGLPFRSLAAAAMRISQVGASEQEVVIPPTTKDFKLPLQERMVELSSFELESDQTLAISTNILSPVGQVMGLRLSPGNKTNWKRPAMPEKEKDRLPITMTTEFTATNPGTAPAHLIIRQVTDIEYPEVRVIPATALALVALFVVYFVVRMLLPKIAAIALTTSKESMAQPLFYLVLALGCCALVAFIFIPYNTFGEDVKMLKDSGLTLIMVLSIIVAVWSASVSVSEEVEGRTALTVLSKPVKRRQFILGKFLGVLGPVVVLFIALGTLFLITVSYKVVYDSREVAKSEPTWQLCYLEMIRILPGLVLAFLETVVMAAISVAISTRLPMLANLIVCASIYVLGHLVPMLVNSSVGKFEIVRFVGQFIATVLPVLDHFNIQAAVAAGAVVPLGYLGYALLYCVVYSGIAMLLGLAMFEDRDLA